VGPAAVGNVVIGWMTASFAASQGRRHAEVTAA
jgi:hypothetical protein